MVNDLGTLSRLAVYEAHHDEEVTMKRFVLAAAGFALAAALIPVAALAKGASEATITGPGLDRRITLAGEGAPDGGALMRLAESAGFFPAVFATTPNPMLTKRPAGTLGPKYRITYTMPGPNSDVSKIKQDLYPFARPAPVSYTKPGQTFFEDQKTVGGWFVANVRLKQQLVAVGLPRTPPAGGGGFDPPWLFVGLLAVAAAAGAAVVGAGRLRRKPRPVTA
jgi:hypothetical protein